MKPYLIHVVIFAGTIDRPLSLNLLSFHIAILGSLYVTLWVCQLAHEPNIIWSSLILGSFSAREAEGEISIEYIL